MERNFQLRTKAMREKDELREIKKYKYSVIRVRFPDGVFLQVIKSLLSLSIHNRLKIFQNLCNF